jgi:ribosomal protein L6P/L9E
LWYDAFNSKNSIQYFKYKKNYLNAKLVKTQIGELVKTINNSPTIFYVLPNNWDLVITFNNNTNFYHLFFFSKTYFVNIIVFSKKNNLNFDLCTNQIYFNKRFTNSYVVFYNKLISLFYTTLVKPIYSRLKFKGKGYYIYKSLRNTITPQFGYSHRLYLYSFFINIKFLNKTTLICFGLSQNYLNFITTKFYYWRPINIFTGRGVRFSKQLIYKKSGKVSSYR